MFSAAELSDMRSAQDLHMMDTGYVQTYSDSTNSFGEVVRTFSDSATTTACGLDMRPGSETQRPDKTVVVYDATLRLPIATAITEANRFRLTKRFGETLSTPLVFEVVAPVQRGPSGIRVLLRKVNP